MKTITSLEFRHWSDPRLNQAIKWSIAAHVLAFVAALIYQIQAPSKPKEILPSLRVDLVALPDQLKNEAVQPAITPPPESKIKESKPAAKTKTVNDADVSLKKTKKAAAERQKKMKDALTRLKALQSLQQFKGNAISKGTVSTGEVSENIENLYYDGVLEKIRSQWQLPKWLQDETLRAQVVLTIDRNGDVVRVAFKRQSGNESFDLEVKQAILKAQPFPRPPKEILEDVSVNGILLGFPL